MRHITWIVMMVILSVLPIRQTHALVWNNPWPAGDALKNIYYSSFAEQPKTLDPARSYSTNEYQFSEQIYEPPLQYDYFARPYQLVPLTAVTMPEVRCLDKQRRPLLNCDGEVGYSVYSIRITSGILFQPHPALARNVAGQSRYLSLIEDDLDEQDISVLSDFHETGTRELTADDYIYQIKRLATPWVNSPIYGLLAEQIEGFGDFARRLPKNHVPGEFVDLRQYSLAGVRKIDNYAFEITLTGHYPQFMFWLAMPFFSPLPWEADAFYSQPGMLMKNLSLDWYPLGTGPFMLTENNPNRRMVLDKNPNYRLEFFPTNGSAEDQAKGYLRQVGQRLPMIDRAVFALEKESIPRWNKFLQGYYDQSGISSDSYDQAIQLTSSGTLKLSPDLRGKNMHLTETLDPSMFYLGFNLLDSVVGGYAERAQKLRLAISIAVNYDENISIFYNGRGRAAQGPLPPGIFGYKEGAQGINPYVYHWDGQRPVRRSIEDARALMREAGYPDGRDPSTGRALILHYDVSVSGGPDEKSRLDWVRKQFARIGIDLDVRTTQYNRFQEKLRTGNVQIFSWSWSADYPDPENFLFILYGSNGKVAHGGENSSNYSNPEYDRLFDLMKNRPNDARREQLIDAMMDIVRHDAPLVWGFNSQTLYLSQQWLSPVKPNTLNFGWLKYIAIDVAERDRLRTLWNQPILWPLALLCGMGLLALLPLYLAWRRKEKCPALRMKR